MTTAKTPCPLCKELGGELVWQDEVLRVILANEPNYPGWCRVVWNKHVTEMTELSAAERAWCMEVVWAVERAVRTAFKPAKVNLAALGNMVPHVHWHVVPRFADDAHFPQAPWGNTLNEVNALAIAQRAALVPALKQALLAELEDLDF